MSNACLKAIRFQAQIPRSSRLISPTYSHSPNTFFSRFYSVTTAPVRTAWLSQDHAAPDQHQRQRRRFFHDSPPNSKRSAPGTVPKRTPPVKPARAPTIPSLGELSQEELDLIFEAPIGVDAGNSVLQTLQYRRITGSLIEHGLNIEGTDIPWEARQRALKWLRDKYPLDEQTAATDWANRAAVKLQETYISRAERFNLIRKRSDEELRLQKEAQPPSATSAFDRIRARNEERAEKAAEARRQSGEEQRSNELRLARIEEQKSLEEQRQVALAKRKEEIIKNARVTNMTEEEARNALTTSQRLLPSTAFALLVIAVLAYGAAMYTPPDATTRLLPDIPPPVATAVTILGICVTITCLWHLPPFHRTFNKFLIVCPAWPFAIGILGNVFSHQSFVHLTMNMLGLGIYGISLHDSIGRGNFVAIYFIGGVFGALISMYSSVLRGAITTVHFGASGCVWAVMVAWGVLRYKSDADHKEDSTWRKTLDIARYGILASQVLVHLVPQVGQTIDVVAHAGGAFVGLIGAWLLQARAREESTRSQHLVKAPDEA